MTIGGGEKPTPPDPLVRAAAAQYDAARQLLAAGGGPGSGVLFPLLNASIVAVELYLKSLAASQVNKVWSFVPVFWTVHAKPEKRGHGLIALLEAIPNGIRITLEQEFERGSHSGGPLHAVLENYEGLFEISRYPYEVESNVQKYPVAPLMRLVDFLRDFVASRAPSGS